MARHLFFAITLVGIGVLLNSLHTVPAQAQNTRSFVSPTGNDSNNCSFAAPCRTFAGAIVQTNSGGEIAVLATAGYGSFTIDRAISIVNPGGVEAGIAVASGATGITINAGPNDIVSLRGLTLEGAGIGQNGIVFNTGARLEILDSVVRNFADTGIFVQPNAGGMTLLISNTHVLDIPNSAGIDMAPRAAGMMRSVIDRVTVSNSYYGVYLNGSTANSDVLAVVSNSIITNSAVTGIAVTSNSALGAEVDVKNSSVAYCNTAGISASGTSVLLIDQTMVAGCPYAIKIGSGSIAYSVGNNNLSRNTFVISGGALTTVPLQ